MTLATTAIKNFPLSNLMGLVGIVVLLLIAYLFSNNRKAIKWKIVVGGLILEVVLAFFIIKTQAGQLTFVFFGK